MVVKDKLQYVGIVESADDQEATVRIFPEFCAGLKGLEGFSHVFILYWMHCRDDEANRRTLLVFPKRHASNVETGVFACRSPSRPNPVGLCVVELKGIEGCTLKVKGLDADKGSPIIDIKPYVPRADSVPEATVPEWTARGPNT
jgi:tRNA-Thr(GGU) m(6)t(6)A37 methyltransferase TsaA